MKIYRIITPILLLSAFCFLLSASNVSAATNISSGVSYEHWAWNDNIGWIDFYSTNNVNVALQK